NGLAAAGLEFTSIRTFATPRRLTAVVEGLPPRSPDIREERKGPRLDAPEAAIKGFLKAAGLPSIDKAEKRDDKKGAYYVAIIERPGRATSDVIAAIVPEIVRSFPWPKSMRWGSGKLRWVRPLHSILCLREGKVILDGEERARIIAEEARSQAARHGLALVEDEGLLAENAGLTEWPVALMGSFDESFLAVPPEVLSTAMKAHQKCFSIRNGENLANRFVLVANLKAEDKGHAIIAGNERVIAARLADAKFFFDHDRKVLLPDRVPKLK